MSPSSVLSWRSAGVCLLVLLLALLSVASVEAGTRFPSTSSVEAQADEAAMPAHWASNPAEAAAASAAVVAETDAEEDATPSNLKPPGPGAYGLDISSAVSKSAFQCLVKEGYSFVVARVWRSLCSVDLNAVSNVDNAWAAGMKQVVYFYPAKGCALTAQQQVQKAIAAMQGHKFNIFWLDIETANSGWTTPSANMAWVKAAVAQAIAQLGSSRVGIYTNKNNWATVMGTLPGFPNLPLWYAHYDNKPNFSDWVPFGGWKTPLIKQFNNGPPVCGVSMDHNFIPL